MTVRRALRASAILLALGLGLVTIAAWQPSTRSGRARAAQTDACATQPDNVARVLATLTPTQRVGQLFMVGLKSGATDDEAAKTYETIVDLHAGNVVFYGTGWSSGETVYQATEKLQTLATAANGGIQAYISGNQEGGQWGAFQAFYGPGFSAMPSPITQAQGDPGRLEEQARIWGVQLSNAGINLNLAPVLDTVPPGTAAANSPIGYWGREYGFTPEEVTRYGVTFARGMRAAPLDVAIKHFPGLGRVSGNTDFTAEGDVDEEFSGLDDPYLAPYKAAIDDGVTFVLVSLAFYPKVDSQQTAFSSVILRDILRTGLGFDGVIISDDVGQAAAVADRTPAQRAVDFFSAGGDMLLTVIPSDIGPMTAAVTARATADATFKASIEASVERVLRAKDKAGLLPKPSSC